MPLLNLVFNVLLLISFFSGAKAQESQAQNNSHVTSADAVVLASAEVDDCGVRYEIKRDAIGDRQREWLSTILNFIHTPDQEPNYRYERRSATPISEPEFQTLISKKEFKHWAGPSVLKAIKEFLSARKLIGANKADFNKGGIIGKYESSRGRLISSLEKQFKMTTIDMGNECD